jgi:hypothetical protein
MKKGQTIMLYRKVKDKLVREGVVKLKKRISGDLWKVRFIKDNRIELRTVREEKREAATL